MTGRLFRELDATNSYKRSSRRAGSAFAYETVMRDASNRLVLVPPVILLFGCIPYSIVDRLNFYQYLLIDLYPFS